MDSNVKTVVDVSMFKIHCNMYKSGQNKRNERWCNKIYNNWCKWSKIKVKILKFEDFYGDKGQIEAEAWLEALENIAKMCELHQVICYRRSKTLALGWK